MKCTVTFLLILGLLLPVVAVAQDTTALEPTEFIPGSYILFTNGDTVVATQRFWYDDEFNLIDSAFTYDLREPGRSRLLDRGFPLVTPDNMWWNHEFDWHGAAIVIDSIIIVVQNGSGHYGDVAPLRVRIGPIEVVARVMGNDDELWHITIQEAEYYQENNPDDLPYAIYPGGFACYDDYLLLAAGSWGLLVYDISDINDPQEAANWDIVCTGVATIGDRVILFNSSGLNACDAESLPEYETFGDIEIRTEEFPFGYYPVFSDERIYLTRANNNEEAEYVVLDPFSEPPFVELGRLDLTMADNAPRVAIDEERLFTYTSGTVDEYEVTNLDNAQLIRRFTGLRRDNLQLVVRGNLMLTASNIGYRNISYEDSIAVFNIGQNSVSEDFILPLSPFILLSTYPNPFNSTTTIRFILPQPGQVSLAMYDVMGRRVRELTPAGWFGTGPHELIWEAQGIASGKYVIRLESGKSSHTGSVQLVR